MKIKTLLTFLFFIGLPFTRVFSAEIPTFTSDFFSFEDLQNAKQLHFRLEKDNFLIEDVKTQDIPALQALFFKYKRH
jgi:hypothetical protein